MCCHACNTPPSTVPTSVTYSHTPATHRQQCNISHAQSHACNTPPSTVPTLVTCRHTPATHRQQCNISHVQSHACNTPPPAMQHQSGTVTRLQHTAASNATSVRYSHTHATHRRQQCQHQSRTVTRLQHTAVNSANISHLQSHACNTPPSTVQTLPQSRTDTRRQDTASNATSLTYSHTYCHVLPHSFRVSHFLWLAV